MGMVFAEPCGTLRRVEHGGKELWLVAASAEERIAQAAAHLASLRPTEHALLLAASPSALTGLVARALPREGARFGWHKRTLDMLAAELALPALARAGRTRVSSLACQALCARVVHELAARAELGRYADMGERPGFVRALVKTLSELRLAGVEARELAAHDPDLATLLAGYVAALDEAQLADRALVLESAAATARSGEHALVGLHLVALDLVLVHRREAELFAALTRRARSLFVSTVAHDERTHGYLMALAPKLTPTAPASTPRTDLELMRERLFRAPPHPPAPEVERGHVRLVSSPGEGREAVEIARAILEAARAGVRFDRMAIALRASSSYRAVVEEALARAHIPALFAEGVERPNREGRALMALLECARRGLSAAAFAEYLSLGVAPRRDGDEDDTKLVSPRRWERMMIDAAVVGGRARWERRLRGLAQELTHEAAHLEVDDPRRASLARDAASLEALLEFALPVLDALQALPHGESWGAWLAALDRLARLALREPDEVCAMLLELAPLAPIGPVSLGDVVRTLGERSTMTTVRESGSSAGKVFVGAIEDLLGRSFELVFVPGLAEKVFPPRISEDALLPDELRGALSRELLLTEERVARERLLLRVAAGAAERELVVSFPRFDLDHGRPRVPSFYGLEVLHALDGVLPAFDDLSRRAHPGAAARMGWPAPDRATQAIDDAEYDLTVLELLLRASADRRPGAAAYLLAANPHLARALRFRARRWMLGKFSPADGFVATTDEGRAQLAPHRLSARAYSATALAQLAGCPYRFFLHAIMRVAPRDEVLASDELDARQRGILVHAVQRDTLTTLRARGLLPLSRETLGEARDVLARSFAEHAERAREEYAPAIEGVFHDALQNARADLDEWLALLADDRVFTPSYFELGFGVARGEGLDAASRDSAVKLPIGLELSGVIDLVESSRASDQPLVLRATDHKTGAVLPALDVVSGGTVLQPLLYALALETLFPDAKVASGRLHFCTSRAGFVSHEVPLDARARHIAAELARSIDGLLAQGFLPAAPKTGECDTCAYRAVCGPYEEQRVVEAKAKDLGRLAALYHVRNLP